MVKRIRRALFREVSSGLSWHHSQIALWKLGDGPMYRLHTRNIRLSLSYIVKRPATQNSRKILITIERLH